MIVGIVGKANVGKSTFFKSATLADVEIANYPFATIKPNVGVAYVKISDVANEFGKVSNPRDGFVMGKYRFVPFQLIDVAGLVPGASEGKGLGNQFLDDLRQADCLIHIIDAAGSTNEKGEPVKPGTRDPLDDVRFLEIELDLWYLGIMNRGWMKFAKKAKMEHKDAVISIATQFSGLGVNEDMVKKAIKNIGLKTDNFHEWREDELKKVATELRKRTKPMIIAANKIDIPIAQENIKRIKKEFPDYIVIGCSSESELALREAGKHNLINYIPGEKNFELIKEGNINEKQKNALDFIQRKILTSFGSTGVQQILNAAVFDKLNYLAIFPGGVSKLEDSQGRVIPDCFLMPPKSTALDFAYKLHSDFGDNFIKAIDVRTKKAVGREHEVKHLDIYEICYKK